MKKTHGDYEKEDVKLKIIGSKDRFRGKTILKFN